MICFDNLYFETESLNSSVVNRLYLLTPYEFTLLSNEFGMTGLGLLFYYLMNLHYSQTTLNLSLPATVFYYLMNLHYSQTQTTIIRDTGSFYYLMNLHYSQTELWSKANQTKFYYLMNLHYSQTISLSMINCLRVLLPYEFTLLSNKNLSACFTNS